jgi:hypothetical protein
LLNFFQKTFWGGLKEQFSRLRKEDHHANYRIVRSTKNLRIRRIFSRVGEETYPAEGGCEDRLLQNGKWATEAGQNDLASLFEKKFSKGGIE